MFVFILIFYYHNDYIPEEEDKLELERLFRIVRRENYPDIIFKGQSTDVLPKIQTYWAEYTVHKGDTIEDHAKDIDRVMMVQFHQSYSYEDFIMGFRPSATGFELKKGAFYNFCKKAEINNFEFINNKENREYYKWLITKRFKTEMDKALLADKTDFPERLLQLKKLSDNMIDSYTQPFYGLSKFAEEEPETVCAMFRDLYAEDGGDIRLKQEKILDFLRRSHALREEYFPGSYLYKDDFHSVTGYMFLYDPDHNYLYKYSHAHAFADCVEFYDDWGYGESVKLDVYYHMCDQLVEYAKKDEALMKTDASRFTRGWGSGPEDMHPDPEKHILAFDLIFCCGYEPYGLFTGITYTKRTSKEKQLWKERRAEALKLYKIWHDAREKYDSVQEAREYVNSVLQPGTKINHISYGYGSILENSGSQIVVSFDSVGTKKLGQFVSVANGLISADLPGGSEAMDKYRDVVAKTDGDVKTPLENAEKNLSPYLEYLE